MNGAKCAALAMGVIMLIGTGCSSTKQVLIKSEPTGANIAVNGGYVGRTPVTYRFRDDVQLFSVRGTDDYVVEATLDGYKADTRVFKDTGDTDVHYVPDVILFELREDKGN